MYSKNNQPTSEKYPNFTTFRRTPELHQKSYSFKDPLYQSFGNGYLSQVNLPHQQKFRHEKQADRSNQTQEDAQVLNQALEIADKFAILKSMLKIIKPLCSPSLLLANTQNKLKTEMIIQSKCKNEDQDSKILCENANKYLSFLEILKLEQIKYPLTEMRSKMSENDVKINLESRIQNRTLPFSNQSQFLTDTNPNSKDLSSKGKNFNSIYLQKPQSKQESNINHSFADESFPCSKQNEFDSQHNPSFTNQDHSKYLTSYQKGSQITYNSENTDHMFQKIQTPKMYQDHQDQNPYFTPFQQSNPSKSRSKDERLQAKKFRKFEKEPPSSAVLQTKSQKVNSNLAQRENIHNQKMHKEFRIEEHQYSRNTNQVRKQMKRSSSSKSQSFISQYKGKQAQKVISKTGKQKIKIGKDVKMQEKSKNLAFKVLDKTNQFQKMLKMTSSRINPT